MLPRSAPVRNIPFSTCGKAPRRPPSVVNAGTPLTPSAVLTTSRLMAAIRQYGTVRAGRDGLECRNGERANAQQLQEFLPCFRRLFRRQSHPQSEDGRFQVDVLERLFGYVRWIHRGLSAATLGGCSFIRGGGLLLTSFARRLSRPKIPYRVSSRTIVSSWLSSD